MKTFIFIIIISLLFSIGCSRTGSEHDIERWKAEIVAVEKAFNDMAQEEGLVKAFEYYAANDGVLKRSNKIIKGKNAIAEWYRNDVKPNETLTWTPTFVDVSVFGDLAYTYGDFTFTYPDSSGEIRTNTGIFHTVWKRQSNGDWRFVWD
ncbi:MAG: hypothetical protein BalsKO_08850 [Balneolaceae bacterium]